MRRLATLVVLLLGGATLMGGVAEAHANYVRSNPASDARLVRPPTEVRIEFSEPPDPRGSEIQVLDTAGRRHDGRDVALSGDRNGLRVSLAAIGEGGYLVSWSVLSAVDGHTTKGSFAFVVGSGPIPQPPDIGDPVAPPAPPEIVGRLLSYAGIALGLGTAFFVLFVRAPAVTEETRRESWLLLVAGALIFAGSVALVYEQGTRLPPRLGAMLTVRGLTGIVIAALSAAPALARMRPVAALAGGGVMTLGALAFDRQRRVMALAAGLAAALTATLVSHAAAVADPKAMLLDYIHVVAVSVWSGGVVALIVIVLLLAREGSPEQRRALGATVWRFSMTALLAVAVLVTTGTLQALDRLVLIQDLYETPYGIALGVKIMLLVVALALASFNLLRWGPRLRAGLAARTSLLRGAVGETAAFIVIVVAASFLTAFAPPAQPSGAAFDETHHVSGLRLEMLVASAQPGRNRYVLRVNQGLAPVQGAEKVAFRFTMVEHDMGEQELVATERRPGEYAADGSPTAMFGTWRIQAIVRLAGREDVSTVFSFPVAGGTTSQSAVISAAPYTMIVFTDPAEPQAGAPIELYVVLIGQDGNPVIGKQLRATFAGREPLTATEDAATLGPGRYRFQIDALEAGTHRVAIAIGSEASGTYSLTVSR